MAGRPRDVRFYVAQRLFHYQERNKRAICTEPNYLKRSGRCLMVLRRDLRPELAVHTWGLGHGLVTRSCRHQGNDKCAYDGRNAVQVDGQRTGLDFVARVAVTSELACRCASLSLRDPSTDDGATVDSEYTYTSSYSDLWWLSRVEMTYDHHQLGAPPRSCGACYATWRQIRRPLAVALCLRTKGYLVLCGR